MNGRIYDAKLGRFLQADPFIQAASNTQSYNRYSYVMNNPLNATDPSGFFLKKLWNEIRPYVGAIVAIVATYICSGNVSCGQAAWAWIGAASGAAGAAANGAEFSGIILGAVTGMAGSGGNFWVSAFMGGAVSYMTGGSFGRGFVAAGIGHFVGAQGFTGMDGFIAASLAGGVASKITGGKFKNGAATAAFMWALRAGVSKAQENWGRGTPKDPDEGQAYDTTLDVKTREYVDENGVTVREVSYKGDVYGSTGLESVAIDEIEQRWNGSWVDESGVRYELSVDLDKGLFGGDIPIRIGECPGQYACAHLGGIESKAITITKDISIASDGMAFAHEFGHLLGFKHSLTGGDVMSYDYDGAAGLRHTRQLWERNH